MKRILIALLLLISGVAWAGSYEEAVASRERYLQSLTRQTKRLPELIRQDQELEARHRARLERAGKMTDLQYETIVKNGAGSLRPRVVPLRKMTKVDRSKLSAEQVQRLSELDAKIQELEGILPELDDKRRRIQWLEEQLDPSKKS